ncbi:hypothetical protein DOY81_014731, partial [Sarcophaga bullata]
LTSVPTESEDDYMSVTSSAIGDGTWENNWLFRKKKFNSSSSVAVSSAGMLVPDPSEDIRAQIGDKTADEVSDLSELGSDTDDSLDIMRTKLEPINDRLANKHLIGGENDKIVLDELIKRSSMVSNTLPETPHESYTDTLNENVVDAPVMSEAINNNVNQCKTATDNDNCDTADGISHPLGSEDINSNSLTESNIDPEIPVVHGTPIENVLMLHIESVNNNETEKQGDSGNENDSNTHCIDELSLQENEVESENPKTTESNIDVTANLLNDSQTKLPDPPNYSAEEDKNTEITPSDCTKSQPQSSQSSNDSTHKQNLNDDPLGDKTSFESVLRSEEKLENPNIEAISDDDTSEKNAIIIPKNENLKSAQSQDEGNGRKATDDNGNEFQDNINSLSHTDNRAESELKLSESKVQIDELHKNIIECPFSETNEPQDKIISQSIAENIAESESKLSDSETQQLTESHMQINKLQETTADCLVTKDKVNELQDSSMAEPYTEIVAKPESKLSGNGTMECIELQRPVNELQKSVAECSVTEGKIIELQENSKSEPNIESVEESESKLSG